MTQRTFSFACAALALGGALPIAGAPLPLSVALQARVYHVRATGFSCDYLQNSDVFTRFEVEGAALPLTVRVELREGTAGLPIKATGRHYSTHTDHDGIQFEEFYPIGVGFHVIEVHPTYVRYVLRLRSNVRDARMIECRLGARLSTSGAGWSYWDGLAENPVALPTRPVTANSISIERGPGMGIAGYQGETNVLFPACALTDGSHGLGLGLSPEYLCSYYGSAYVPAGAGGGEASYGVRAVLAPGQTVEFAFVLIPRETRWGARSIVDGYYRTAPARFDRNPSQFPDAYGLYRDANVRNVIQQGDRFIEFCRRCRVAALHFGGTDPSGDVEDGALSLRPRGRAYTAEEPAVLCYARGPGDRKELEAISQRTLKAAFRTANIAALPVNYVIPSKCDYQLATRRFPESIARLPDGRLMLHLREEGLLWAAMNPGETAFGDRLRSDIFQRIDHYHPKGLYFDNGAVNWRDYAPGRMAPAFDDSGRVYSDVGLGYAWLLDQIHARYPGVFLDPGEFLQYFVTARTDSYLVNLIGRTENYARNSRYLLGKKLMYYRVEQYDPHPGPAANKPPPTLQTLEAFRWGAPAWLDDACLVRPDARLLGTVFGDLALAGWEPISHARCDNAALWVERFQRGREMLYFTVVNPTNRRQRAVVTIDDRLHGDGLLPACVPYVGTQSLMHRYAPANGSVAITVELKPASVLVLRGAAWLRPSGPLQLAASADDNRATFQITDGAPQTVAWAANALRGAYDRREIASVACGGRRFDGSAQALPARLDVTPGSAIEVRWASRYQLVPGGCDFAAVTFLRDAAPVSIIADRRSPAAYDNARRIRGFVEYQAELNKTKAEVEIVPSPDRARYANRVIVAAADADSPDPGVNPRAYLAQPPLKNAVLIAVNPATLALTGNTERDMELVLDRYLDSIETPAPYRGPRLDSLLTQTDPLPAK